MRCLAASSLPARPVAVLALAAIAGVVLVWKIGTAPPTADRFAPDFVPPSGFDAFFRDYERRLARYQGPARRVEQWHPLHRGDMPSPRERIDHLLTLPLLADRPQQRSP